MVEETAVVETEDTITPDEMSEEQLDLALAESQKEDAQSTEVVQSTEKTETKVDETTEQSSTGQVAQKTEVPKSEVEGQNALTGNTVSETEKLRIQLEEKELFLQRQANEIGELRKRVNATPIQPVQPPLNPDDLLGLDPITAVEIVLAHKDNERQIAFQQQAISEQNTRNIVTTIMPNVETLIDDIVLLAKEDGVSNDILSSFRLNPWQAVPEVLLNYAKRAELVKKMRDLETEVVTLRKKPSEVVSKIEAAAKLKPMTSTTGIGSAGKPPVSVDQFNDMSEAEIDAELEKRNEARRR